MVGQIAKIKGARAIGIAGGKDKCDFVKNDLGFDDCLDHVIRDIAGAEGGMSQGHRRLFRERRRRRVRCGVSATQHVRARARLRPHLTLQRDRAATPKRLPLMMRAVLTKRLTIRGFIVSDFAARHARVSARHVEMAAGGHQASCEFVTEGLESAPGALIGPAQGCEFRQESGAGRTRQSVSGRK